MSVVRLEKVTVVGLAGERDRVLEDLQTLGCMHLIPLDGSREAFGATDTSPKAREALKFLIACPRRWRQSRLNEKFDPINVEQRALEIRQRLLDLKDEKDALVERIERLTPFGDFEFPAREELGGYRLWFYEMPHSLVAELDATGLIWERINRDSRTSYVVVLSEMEPQGMPVPRLRTGGKSRRELERVLETVEMETEDLRAERAALSRWILLYTRNLDRLEDQAALDHARTLCQQGEGLFGLHGWVAVSDVPDLRRYASEHGLALETSPPAPEDHPPVVMHNPPRLSYGEQLLAFYQLPGYRDWDPSSVVFLSFAIFFAMILADAGYAALLGVVLLLLWKRLGREASGRGLRNLLLTLVGASVAFGTLVGSYFGVTPSPESALGKLKLLEINDFDSMMRLSILIGGAHLILANARTAWHRRRQLNGLASVGWVAVLVGGLMAYVGLETSAVPAGLGVMGAGGVLILLFTSMRPLRRPLDLLWRLIDGLLGLTNFSGMFGDILSYLRLFALGLSSASLALTFNALGGQVADAGDRRGIALFLGLLILVVGHTLNLTLGVISGVVHGLRLNLIEFYKWSVFDEGTPFRAFRRKENVS